MQLKAGEVLFRPGESGDSMYRVRSGRLAVIRRDPGGRVEALQELGPGETIGEMALLMGNTGSGQLRTAEVSAITDVEIDVITRSAFDRLAAECPAQVQELVRTVAPRIRRQEAEGLLRCYFGEVDAAALDAIEAALAWVDLPRGQTLFRQGDPSDALYFIVHGCVGYVAIGEDGTERVRFQAGQGETIGEFGLLTGAPRSATATARRDTVLLRMSRAVFDDLTSKCPGVALAIARNAFARQARQSASSATSGTGRMFALVSLSPDVPFESITQRLKQSLDAIAPTYTLSSATVDAELGRPGLAQLGPGHPVQPMLQAWLDDREQRYRYLIYQADLGPTSWTDRCLRQADTVVLLGDGASGPQLGQLAPLLAAWAQPEQTMLVLLHAEGRRPRGTGAWLDHIPVRAHYHLQADVPGDMSHLARVLTQRSLGLVLGGGGARGFGHIGVMRAMRELDLVPDYFGGSSIGALVGGLFASGMNDEEVQSLGLRIGSRAALLDRTLPLVSLYQTAKITRILHELFDDTQIEDLWRPYFAVTCNLSRGMQMILQRGPLWEAIRASMAATPIFTPIVCNGDLLADGGFVNNVPVDLMRALVGPGKVIGIDCSPLAPKQRPYDFGPSISGWAALWERIKPFGRRRALPDMAHLFSQVMDTNGLYRIQMVKDKADLIVRLPIRDYGMLDFDHAAEIIEIGYETARKELAEWKAAALHTPE